MENVRAILDRMAGVANFSVVQAMEAAGLSRHAFVKWRNGERTPTPENLRAVGRALLERGGAMQRLGEQLIGAAAGLEERQARP